MSVQSFVPAAPFETAAPRRLRPDYDRREPSQEFTLPEEEAPAAPRASRAEVQRAIQSDRREASQAERAGRKDDKRAQNDARKDVRADARSDAARDDSEADPSQASDADEAKAKTRGDARSEAPSRKAQAGEPAEIDGSEEGKGENGKGEQGKGAKGHSCEAHAAAPGQVKKLVPPLGRQEAGALVTIAAAEQGAIEGASGAGKDSELQAGQDKATTSAEGTPAETAEAETDPADEFETAAMMLLLAETAQSAKAEGEPAATGQAVAGDAAQQQASAVDAAILLAATVPAAAPGAAGPSEGETATAVAANAIGSQPGKSAGKGLEQAGKVSVAQAAREEIAEDPEGAADKPFGATVSALAKGREAPTEGAQGATPTPPATPEPGAAEPKSAPATPIDLSFLSQVGQPKADRPGGLHPTPDTAPVPGQPGQHAAPSGPATPMHVVPIEIGLRALAGARKFDIRLDPAELGRVDVNLQISDAGEVSAKLVVDRVETLHLLQRDARTLERAFEQAGLKPTDGGVEITLRDPTDQSGFRQNRNQDEPPRRGRSRTDTPDDSVAPVEAASARRLVRLGAVDLSI